MRSNEDPTQPKINKLINFLKNLRFHKSLITLHIKFSWLVNLIWKDKRKEALFVGWDRRRWGDDASVPQLPETDSERQQVCGG